MKIRLITCLFTVLLIGGNLQSSPVENLNAYFEANKGECYYWNTLHHPTVPAISKPDLVFLLDGNLGQNKGAAISPRDLSAALFLARHQGIEMSPDLLLQNLDSLTLPEGRNRELRLITELSLTLASLGPEARDAMYPLRHSGDETVANAIVSALSVYGGEKMRERIYNEIRAIREEDMRKLKARSLNFQFNSFPNLPASTQLDYYFTAKERQLEGPDLLEFMGKMDVVTVSTTARDTDARNMGSYLSINFGNVYWLSRLNVTLSNAASSLERVQMEQIVRDAFNRNHSPENVLISYRAKIYYLLGFELTEAEKEYLTDVLGLKESEFLPRGKIHLAGFNLDDFQRSDEQQLVATPEPADLITPIAEVTSERANEKPAEVKTTEPSEEPSEQSTNWWLWLIGLLIVVGGLAVVVRRKS